MFPSRLPFYKSSILYETRLRASHLFHFLTKTDRPSCESLRIFCFCWYNKKRIVRKKALFFKEDRKVTLEEAFLLDTLRCRFKFLREERGLSPKEVCQHLDVSYPDYTLYEAGDRLPDVLTLLHAASLYNVSVDYLLGQTERPERYLC
ncbi:predicted protein [Enterococcus casseliflavus EC30]|nr:predicted protein [Enterococcus casseliflavus EC30]